MVIQLHPRQSSGQPSFVNNCARHGAGEFARALSRYEASHWLCVCCFTPLQPVNIWHVKDMVPSCGTNCITRT
eukprot:1466854-Amphidinium_carterae.1